jgi:phosphatidylglycerophosphatase A
MSPSGTSGAPGAPGAPARRAAPGRAPSRRRAAADLLAVLAGSFAMTGFFPVSPATVASAVATPLLALAYRAWPGIGAQAALCAGILVLGVWSAGRLERIYGKDPSAAVIDEVLGMALTLFAAPITPAVLVLGFLLFRVFDILKLPPGRAFERLHGGWGIMLDDACAGVYGAVVLRAILFVWPEPRLATWHLVPLGALAVLLLVFRKPLLRRYGKPRCLLPAARRGAAGSAVAPPRPGSPPGEHRP